MNNAYAPSEQDIVDIICGEDQTPEEIAAAIKRLIEGPPAPPEPTPLSAAYLDIVVTSANQLGYAANKLSESKTFEELDEQIDLLEIYIGTLHAVRGKGGPRYYSRGPARVYNVRR